MTLIEAVKQLAELDGGCTIYARSPWASSTEAKLAVEGSDEEKKAKSEGLGYFLEVSIAREFLDDWRLTQKKPPTVEQSCARLVEYATNDA